MQISFIELKSIESACVLSLLSLLLFRIIGNNICVGGNLVAVQASRLYTTLHQQGKPREFQHSTQYHASTFFPNSYKIFCSITRYSSTTRVLLFLAIPGHLTFVFVIS
ncbi:unnamed protein product [Adineta steineri]|uniref:Uncharacterized protein n=1 Tax=Adineta steineri TaxID=433720 RepID=A0A815BEZ3_9BILA|nr:unnamed protein product [Adineta steineri]